MHEQERLKLIGKVQLLISNLEMVSDSLADFQKDYERKNQIVSYDPSAILLSVLAQAAKNSLTDLLKKLEEFT